MQQEVRERILKVREMPCTYCAPKKLDTYTLMPRHIFYILQHWGFGPKFLHWFRVLCSLPSTHVDYCEFQTGPSPIARGTRQGVRSAVLCSPAHRTLCPSNTSSPIHYQDRSAWLPTQNVSIGGWCFPVTVQHANFSRSSFAFSLAIWCCEIKSHKCISAR